MKKIIGKVLWNFAELFNLPLGKDDKYAPIIFGWMIGAKEVRRVK